MVDAGEEGALYVSAVEGRPFTRLGSKVLIGAERDPSNERKIVYRTKDIVIIPADEARRYGREYQRAIADGDLVQHDAAAQRSQHRQRTEAASSREKLKVTHGDPEGSR